MRHWLFKSEPITFSLDHLKACPKKTDSWDGVRNYQARNFMRDEMNKGDLGFFYHSNCAEPGIVGVVKITKEAYPDRFQFDPKSKYYDPKATPDNPRWVNVDVTYVRHLPQIVTLAALKEHPGLRDMKVIARGNRLSITPVTDKEWEIIMAMAEA